MHFFSQCLKMCLCPHLHSMYNPISFVFIHLQLLEQLIYFQCLFSLLTLFTLLVFLQYSTKKALGKIMNNLIHVATRPLFCSCSPPFFFVIDTIDHSLRLCFLHCFQFNGTVLTLLPSHKELFNGFYQWGSLDLSHWPPSLFVPFHLARTLQYCCYTDNIQLLLFLPFLPLFILIFPVVCLVFGLLSPFVKDSINYVST